MHIESLINASQSPFVGGGAGSALEYADLSLQIQKRIAGNDNLHSNTSQLELSTNNPVPTCEPADCERFRNRSAGGLDRYKNLPPGHCPESFWEWSHKFESPQEKRFSSRHTHQTSTPQQKENI
ncbi:hypothetical protein AVEN_182492-1 [Araneus ventricosus]|uniref:Uncharacterized protein n=1 Tax=Araneus ventricosus TaxID=182803 RepID=A0A4Y2BZF2_ARAVE|nr:hypothetical protein AVEN_182492-1 [Araneus ventricosus]